MNRIIPSDKSVMLAADVNNFVELATLAKATSGVFGLSSVKIGFSLGLRGTTEAVQIVRREMGTRVQVVYDHQKAGTDIPETGTQFVKVLLEAAVDAVILFPLAGPATQEAWTKACLSEGLPVIVGGMMTHPQFLVSEGGYIADDAPERIYRFACHLGAQHFVVPGNKIEWVRRIHGWLVEELGKNFVLYAPGFITQGGDVSECGQAAGDKWHAIVGSAIYKKPTPEAMREASVTVTRQIVAAGS